MRTAPVLAVAAAVCFATCAAPGPGQPPAQPGRGAALYERHCAVCHGADGDGDTAITALLLPRPTAFRQGLFKLVSTQNGMPTEADLVATLRRGMPGSSMMSFGWLADADLTALAQHVRQLAVRGRAESIHETAAVAGRPMSLAAATAAAERELAPGAPVELGQSAQLTADTLGQGERLYRQHCATCHGTDGRGLPDSGSWPTDGTWLWPRDFTAGYLRGGSAHVDLAARIRAGMPGAHMPPTRLSLPELEALVAYVQSLIPETAAEHHTQWRRHLRAAKLPQLPADDDQAALAKLDAVRLPTVPLSWRSDACDEVWLRAAHDGRTLLLQLEWADPTRDDRARPEHRLGDGLAVQWTHDREPPLFAMGSRERPVNVWRWHTYDPKELAGMTDLLTQPLHQGLDVPPSGMQPQARTESVQLHGIGSVGSSTGSGLPLTARAHWHDGRWQVVFRRALAARSPAEIDLTAPDAVLLAFAVWDGSKDPSAASKAITTWHQLELAR